MSFNGAAAVATAPAEWQVVDDRRVYQVAMARPTNYYTQTVDLDLDNDFRHLRVVKFVPAPPEQFDF